MNDESLIEALHGAMIDKVEAEPCFGREGERAVGRLLRHPRSDLFGGCARNGMATRRRCSPVATWNARPMTAFRFVACERPPIRIAMLGRRFLKEIEGLFVEVLKIAREMGLLKLGRWR